MTRKDYNLIAKAFADQADDIRSRPVQGIGEIIALATLRNLASRLGEDLARNNPRFDRDRFIDAANV